MIVQQFKMLQTESTDEMEKQTTYSYWNEISKIHNIHGEPKFSEVSKLSKAFLCLTHGNATPERGFSDNKSVLHHRERLQEDTIVALRITKDFLKHCDDVTKFPISERLLTHCRSAYQKYQDFLELQRKEKESVEKQKLNDQKKKRLNEENNKVAEKLKEIDNLIKVENVRLTIAENLVKDSNKSLMDIISSNKTINKNSLVQPQLLLETGIKKMDEIKSSLVSLHKQRNECLKK